MLVPFPFSKSNEARSGSEPLRMILNYLLRVRPGNKPPNNDLRTRALLIGCADLEDVEPLPERATIANWISAGQSHS